MEDVLKKVLAAQEAKKATLKGIELMQWNLFWKLRGWIMREDSNRCVCISELVGKIKKYAPKTILKSRDELVKATEELWGVTHDYSIESVDFLRDDLEFELSFIYK